MMARRAHDPRRGDGLSPTDPRLLGNPLDFLHEDHLREREICVMLDRIAAAENPDQDAAAHAAGFLADELPLHFADEEEDLFPLLRQRCEPEDDIERALARLLADHVHAGVETPDLVRLLRLVAEGEATLSPEDRALLTRYASHSRRHLVLENAIVLPLARARLTRRDLDRMRLAMLHRRGLDRLIGG
jgi:hemerythrin-like domain-containing protein